MTDSVKSTMVMPRRTTLMGLMAGLAGCSKSKPMETQEKPKEGLGKAEVLGFEISDVAVHSDGDFAGFDCEIEFSTREDHTGYMLPHLFIIDPNELRVLEQGPGRVFDPGIESQTWKTGFVPEMPTATTVLVHIGDFVRKIEVENDE